MTEIDSDVTKVPESNDAVIIGSFRRILSANDALIMIVSANDAPIVIVSAKDMIEADSSVFTATSTEGIDVSTGLSDGKVRDGTGLISTTEEIVLPTIDAKEFETASVLVSAALREF